MEARNNTEKLIALANKKIERGIYTRLAQALNCEAISFEDLLNGNGSIPPTQTRVTFYGHSDGDVFGGGHKYYNAEEFSNHVLAILKTNPGIREIDLLACNVGAFDMNGECYASKVKQLLSKSGYDIQINTFVVDNSDNSIVKSFFVVGNLNVDDQSGEKNATGTSYLNADEFSLDILRSSDQGLYAAYMAVREDREHLEEYKLISAILSTFYEIIEAEMNSDEFTKQDALKIFKKSMATHKFFRGTEDFESTLDYIIKKYNIQFMENEKTASFRFNNVSYGFKYRKDISREANYFDDMQLVAKQKYVKSYNECSQMRSERARVMKGSLSDIRTHLKPVMLPGKTAVRTKSPHGARDFRIQSHASSYLRKSNINDFKIFSHASGDILSQKSYDGEAITVSVRPPPKGK
ncbi:hypothetical protein AQUSIP_06560 [Aquicella siphonis]|uniref:Peptidase C80 domain-containing protein n=1 Tax=Aquicella siphonis TaxID=254247 RepID=A0A5E4PG90_9COXI|nr:hypothetical protein [Aquicella siphonis]VVC75366.1 hypothetical protein AQUSIP_06560 [Aquicella siphonis]